MNTRYEQMNAAAIDRHRLVEHARNAQCALGIRSGLRFDEFAQSRAGALYELSSLTEIERALTRFEWTKLDQVYGAIFFGTIRRQEFGEQSMNSLYREAWGIVGDKLRRLARRPPGIALRALHRTSFVVFLALLFMMLSTISGEACLHLAQYVGNIRGIR